MRTAVALLTGILLTISVGCIHSRGVDARTIGGHRLLISGRNVVQSSVRPADLVSIEVPKQRLDSKTSLQIEKVISKAVNESHISIEKEKLGKFSAATFFSLREMNGREYCFVMSSHFFLLKEDRWIQGDATELWDVIGESIENGSIRCKRQEMHCVDVLPSLRHRG